MNGRAGRLLGGLGALVVLVAVIVGVPVVLALLGLVPSAVPSLNELVTVLESRDDGQLLQVVLAAGVWVCWALFTASTVAELVALVHARPAPSLPGLSLFHQPVAALLAAVAVGLTVGPTVGAVMSDGGPAGHLPLSSAVLAGAPTSAAQPDVGTPALRPTSALSPAQQSTPAPTKTYEVQRRDTLWALAERYLGDPLRYPEIVQLNPTAVGPDNEITAGSLLVLPSDATGLISGDGAVDPSTPSAQVEVVVEPGDTLWGITEEVTGDGTNWREAWEANRGRSEPGGAVFIDPALIRPGWELSIPTSNGSVTLPFEPAPAPTPVPVPTEQVPSAPDADLPPAAPREATPSNSSSGAQPSSAHADDAQAEPAGERELVAFTGAGVLLAGVSLMALMRYRRRQWRHRRPGRLISSSPAELVHVERALQSVGSADVTWLDHALRSLVQGLRAVDGERLPDVIAVCMTDDVLTLVLTSPAPRAPAPWTVDAAATRWSIRRDDRLSYDESQRSHSFAPFPTLASVGWTAEGEHWLLDLERITSLSLAGDVDRAADLVRFIAAELAHNTWSEMLQVTLIGFGEELVEINPERLSYSQDVEKAIAGLTGRLDSVTEALQFAGTDVLAGRLHDIAADTWAPHVLLVAPGDAASSAKMAPLLAALKRQESRRAAAVVAVGGPDMTSDVRWRLTIDDTGQLHIPALDLTLRAQQLPAHEAESLAAMLALAASTADVPVPAAHGDQPWEQGTDAAGGALVARDGAASARRPVDVETGMVDAVLPLPDGTYRATAATTERDVRVLAPVLTDAVRQRVKSADTALDQDLADWADSSTPRPKLTLLGPVQVRAQGRLPERNPRRQFYTEIVAYLSTRPGGATSEQYATAIWPEEPDVVGKTKVRQAISVVRAWLGSEPGTGADYLPSGVTAAAAGRYRITDVLIDAELFRRLRVRGLARGADGIPDLRMALDLVSGRPFDLPGQRQGAAGGYSWLLDGNSRLDHEYAAMIVDVAHTVATHHLAAGEPQLAAAAAQVALRAGSFEDVPLLDLVFACDAEGNRAEADAYVARILANHDAEVEEDLPPRTADVLFRRQRGSQTN